MDRVHRPNLGTVPSLQESVIHRAQIPAKEMCLLLLAWFTLGSHCYWPCFWHMGAGAAVWRHLRSLGICDPVGCAVFGPGPLLGLHEGQPPCSELLLSSTMTHRLCLASPGGDSDTTEGTGLTPWASRRRSSSCLPFPWGEIGRTQAMAWFGGVEETLAICFPPRIAVEGKVDKALP